MSAALYTQSNSLRSVRFLTITKCNPSRPFSSEAMAGRSGNIELIDAQVLNFGAVGGIPEIGATMRTPASKTQDTTTALVIAKPTGLAPKDRDRIRLMVHKTNTKTRAV